MEEYLDIYDCDGQHIGIKSRSECHKPNPGYYHKSVWVWVVNDNDEILLQRRAYTKKELPGVWAMPVAGHISAGESPLVTCVREAKEELGLDTSEKDYEFVQEYFHEDGWEYAQAYILRNNTKTKIDIRQFIIKFLVAVLHQLQVYILQQKYLIV